LETEEKEKKYEGKDNQPISQILNFTIRSQLPGMTWPPHLESCYLIHKKYKLVGENKSTIILLVPSHSQPSQIKKTIRADRQVIYTAHDGLEQEKP